MYLFTRIPTSFLPNEDQGILMFQVTAPPGATAERTLESVKQVEDYLMDVEGEYVEHMLSVTGFNFAGMAQNAALGFVMLKDWSERTEPDEWLSTGRGSAIVHLSRRSDDPT